MDGVSHLSAYHSVQTKKGLIGWFSVLILLSVLSPERSYACQKAPPGPIYDLSATVSGRTKLFVWSMTKNMKFKLVDESGEEQSISTTTKQLPATMLQPLATVTERGDVTLYIITPEQSLPAGPYILLTGIGGFPNEPVQYDRSKGNEFYVREKRKLSQPPPFQPAYVSVVRELVYVSYDASCAPIYETQVRVNVRFPSRVQPSRAHYYKLVWEPDGRKKSITGRAHGDPFVIPKKWFGKGGNSNVNKGTLKIIPVSRSGVEGPSVSRSINLHRIDRDHAYHKKMKLLGETAKWFLPFLLVISLFSFLVYRYEVASHLAGDTFRQDN